MAQLVARFHGMEEVGGSNPPSSTNHSDSSGWSTHFGAMAQLVARFHGMEEVGGSNPPSSTALHQQAPPSGEGRFVSLLATGVRGTMRVRPSLC